LVKLPSSQIKGARGTKIDDLVEHIDLYPTIVASLGVPASTSVEGENLFTVKRDWALSEWKVDEWHWHRWGLRTAQYRLMFGVHSDGSPGEITLLFDLISDPLEQKNIAAERPEVVYKYTNKGNLVAVISNGTAVLGLGNIGPDAGKPVMEGKAVLFKRFADIDVFDIEVNTRNTEEFILAVKLLEPTFGGINLEDIAAPECFEIENRLKAEMRIPVFHDDQHGTAIISAAALRNALEVAEKKIGDVHIVVCGAGAAAMACLRLYIKMGLRKENALLTDSKGVIHKGRTTDMTPYKEEFAVDTGKRTLADAMRGADVFIGLSVGGIVTQDMVRSMAANPIVFAMANPDPEISYDDAVAARPDVIMATGRSDYPNQVN